MAYEPQTFDPDVHETATSMAIVRGKAGAILRCSRYISGAIRSENSKDFWRSVLAAIEAAHQQEHWGSTHDVGKTPFDWFWLIGYLAQKAASSAVTGDTEKAMHHTISTAAALLNWHRAISGEMTGMRPGIEPSTRAREASR